MAQHFHSTPPVAKFYPPFTATSHEISVQQSIPNWQNQPSSVVVKNTCWREDLLTPWKRQPIPPNERCLVSKKKLPGLPCKPKKEPKRRTPSALFLNNKANFVTVPKAEQLKDADLLPPITPPTSLTPFDLMKALYDTERKMEHPIAKTQTVHYKQDAQLSIAGKPPDAADAEQPADAETPPDADAEQKQCFICQIPNNNQRCRIIPHLGQYAGMEVSVPTCLACSQDEITFIQFDWVDVPKLRKNKSNGRMEFGWQGETLELSITPISYDAQWAWNYAQRKIIPLKPVSEAEFMKEKADFELRCMMTESSLFQYDPNERVTTEIDPEAARIGDIYNQWNIS